jgi:hypothetical protein
MAVRQLATVLGLLLAGAGSTLGQTVGPAPPLPATPPTADAALPSAESAGGPTRPRAESAGVAPDAAPDVAPESDSEAAPGAAEPEGGPTRPRAESAGVAPSAEEAAAPAEPDTNFLSRLLGLEESPVQLYGWIQNSYTATPGFNPRDGSTVTVFPNRLANAWQGNQYYLVAEKVLKPGDRSDFGFRLDTLFGNDWLYTHSFGLFNGLFSREGFAGVDFPQMYLNAHLPVLFQGGVDIRGGRFYSPAGFESAQATKRPLLSAPYVLNYSPFTFFGMLATFHVSDRLTLTSGAVNGADRWIDSNYHYSYLGGLNWISESKKTTINSNILIGPNQLPFFPSMNLTRIDNLPVGVYTTPELQNRRNPYYNRSTLIYMSNVLVHNWNDRLTEAAEFAFVAEGNVLGLGPGGSAIGANFYGFCHHFLYQFHEKLTGVFRAEIFRDNNGLATGRADTYMEMTLGTIIKPHPWLWVRPEIRYDAAQFTHPYDDGTRHGQMTLAFDVILKF